VPLTLDDLAAHLNAPRPDPDDPELGEWQRALDTAVQGVTRMTGILDGTTAVAQVTSGWDRILPLPYVRLAAVGPVLDPAGTPQTPWLVDPWAGVVTLYAGWPGVWTVTCVGSPWPAELSTAALDWAAHVYETQRTTLNPLAPDDTPALPSFALPNRVAEFVNPYRVPGIA
jgi:hypothetical protein